MKPVIYIYYVISRLQNENAMKEKFVLNYFFSSLSNFLESFVVQAWCSGSPIWLERAIWRVCTWGALKPGHEKMSLQSSVLAESQCFLVMAVGLRPFFLTPFVTVKLGDECIRLEVV